MNYAEMSDAELLKLAANAAGMEAQYSDNFGDFSIGKPYSKGEIRWNPLVDDGDAFRLAVGLGIEVHPDLSVGRMMTAFCIRKDGHLIGLNEEVLFEDEDFSEANDPLSAARLVIVRSAAKIGSMR